MVLIIQTIRIVLMHGYGILKRKLGQILQVGLNRVVQTSDGERCKSVA